MILLAMDRASVRSRDAFQRLHVETSRIAKACVSPYFGREIPHWQELGLAADSIYNMFRHPEELAKAAKSFNRVPLLHVHKPTSARKPEMEVVIGTVGSECAFDGTYLNNSLAFWTQDGIDLLEHYGQEQLSPSYGYRADMTPGTFNGLTYDGIMRDIVANHVALVTEGRQGPDVVVGDESMKTRTALMVSGALAAFVRPKLAQDAKIDLGKPLDDISAANLADRKDALADSIVTLVTPHLAADEQIDKAGVLAAIATVEDVKLASDELGEVKPAPKPAKKSGTTVIDSIKVDIVAEGPTPAPAMDAAEIDRRIAAARAEGVTESAARQVAIRTAEKDVFALVGEVTAMDSAEGIYLLALDSVGIKGGVLKDATLPVLKAMVEREVDRAKPAPRVAMDAVPVDQSAKLFPDAGSLVRI